MHVYIHIYHARTYIGVNEYINVCIRIYLCIPCGHRQNRKLYSDADSAWDFLSELPSEADEFQTPWTWIHCSKCRWIRIFELEMATARSCVRYSYEIVRSINFSNACDGQKCQIFICVRFTYVWDIYMCEIKMRVTFSYMWDFYVRHFQLCQIFKCMKPSYVH